MGVGARGMQEYKFTLDLLNEIDSDNIKIMKTDSKIDIFLPKKKPEWWPRLVRD